MKKALSILFNEKITKVLSVLLPLIPILYVIFVVIFKPTYVTAAKPWNADEYWRLFSIRYWGMGLVLISFHTTLFSVVPLIGMFRTKMKKFPWILLLLISPVMLYIGLRVAGYASSQMPVW